MLSGIGRFIVRIADLAEAEGRLAVRNLVLAAVVVLFAGAAVGLGMTAAVMFAVAAYWALAAVIPPAAALAIAAVLVLAAALGMGGAAYGMHVSRQKAIYARTQTKMGLPLNASVQGRSKEGSTS